jgi:hypothetical protein
MNEAVEVTMQRAVAACILAQEINEGYVGSKDYCDKPKNKSLMIAALIENDPRLEQHTEAADQIINYCQGKMLEMMAGTLSNYWVGILHAINKPMLNLNSHQDVGILASMPSAYERSINRDRTQELREQHGHHSRHFGNPGDRYESNVRIISKVFSIKYGKTWHTGVDEHGNLVNFPYAHDLKIDQVYPIRAKIRKHGDNATTLLNYVSTTT